MSKRVFILTVSASFVLTLPRSADASPVTFAVAGRVLAGNFDGAPWPFIGSRYQVDFTWDAALPPDPGTDYEWSAFAHGLSSLSVDDVTGLALVPDVRDWNVIACRNCALVDGVPRYDIAFLDFRLFAPGPNELLTLQFQLYYPAGSFSPGVLPDLANGFEQGAMFLTGRTTDLFGGVSVVFKPVPEPATLLLFGTGVAAIGFFRRRSATRR